MSDIYIITSGDYSEYSINSVWSSKEIAEKNCELLNAGSRWVEYQVEEWSMDVPQLDTQRTMLGEKAVYDFDAHGLHVDVANVVFTDAIFSKVDEGKPVFTRTKLAVMGYDKEKCLRIVFDVMAQKRAEDEGIVL